MTFSRHPEATSVARSRVVAFVPADVELPGVPSLKGDPTDPAVGLGLRHMQMPVTSHLDVLKDVLVIAQLGLGVARPVGVRRSRSQGAHAGRGLQGDH